MPLPGGPSDKLGNRYEARWVVRHLLDLLTGRIEWIRIEPPGEHAIEFRYLTKRGEEAVQVKRGVASGHWTIAGLKDVLVGFGELLGSEADLGCLFASEHAAPELKELTERARDARDLSEFEDRFLSSKELKAAWKLLHAYWGCDSEETWRRLRRITTTTASEQQLQADADTISGLLLDAPSETVRAVLVDLVLDSIHQELRRSAVLDRLQKHGIHLLPAGTATTVAPTTSAPPATGVRRKLELDRIRGSIAAQKATVLLGGITGIGKTTVASQFAAEWGGPVCWIDCGLIGSAYEAISTISEFLAKVLGDDALMSASAKSRQVEALGRLAGKHLGARGSLLVWDGVDGELQDQLHPIIEAVAGTVTGGAQLVTAKVHGAFPSTACVDCVHVGRLDPDDVRTLLVGAFPNARVPDLEAAEQLTQGHPYLVQLIIGAASSVDLRTAVQSSPTSKGLEAVVSQLLGFLPAPSRQLLRDLSWLGIPFSATNAPRLGGTPDMLRDLAARYLILRVGSDQYRVHEIVSEFCIRAVSEEDKIELHQRAALFLHGLEHPSWLEVRTMLAHARAASMDVIVRRVGPALLTYAANLGYPGLASEAAQAVISTPEGAKAFYPHFMLGKCARLGDDLTAALAHYANAETRAERTEERDGARYERASVLCGLGRTGEAAELFAELAKSNEPATKAEATIALALSTARGGDVGAASAMLDEAVGTAKAAGLIREEAEAWQGKAQIFADAERWEEARTSIKQAHSLRYSIGDQGTYDILGWSHVFSLALRIERALGNKEAARQAAHGLWRFGVISANVAREANAAHAMCLADPDPNNPEVALAISRLQAFSHDTGGDARLRIEALKHLVLCQWSLRQYEPAFETIAELAALGVEHRLRTPVFGHLADYPETEENIVSLPGDGFGLILPPQTGEKFVTDAVTRLVERRPELAKYFSIMVGKLPGSRRPTAPKGTRRKASKRKRKRTSPKATRRKKAKSH